MGFKLSSSIWEYDLINVDPYSSADDIQIERVQRCFPSFVLFLITHSMSSPR